MKVWVISVDIVYEDESYSYVESVFKSGEEAKEVFNQLVKEGKAYKFNTENSEDGFYETYNLGWYNDGLYVVKMEEMELI